MEETGTVMEVIKSEIKSTEEQVHDLQQKICVLDAKLHPAKLELQRREHGHLFSHVRPYSAKETLGKGWKDKLNGHMPSMDLFLNSEKDGLKPVDIMLAGIYSNEAHAIQKGKRITINVTAGDTSYNGTHTALFVDNHNIVIPVVRDGEACGNYQNTEKVENALAKTVSIEKRIMQLQEQIQALTIKVSSTLSSNPAQENDDEETVSFEQKNSFEGKPTDKKHISAMHIVVGVVLTIGVAAAVYYATVDNSEKAAA